MLFNSIHFLIFFIVVFIVTWGLPTRLRNSWLLLASLFFYAYWDWRFLPLMIGSVLVDYLAAIAIEGAWKKQQAKQARAFLWISLAVNLGILLAFKVFGAFSAILNEHDSSNRYGSLAYVIPLGISFYTFQALSYTIDVYRQKTKATRRLDEFMLYISFFPQLVAGPIERAGELIPQIRSDRRITAEAFFDAVFLIIWGLFLKTVVADNLMPFVIGYFENPTETSSTIALLSFYSAMFQVYGDFAGYTAIALGTAKLLGFQLNENFKQPYFAKSPQEFWSRWHITLMNWFRSYLFLPLTNALKGLLGPKLAALVALSCTMLIFALWHAATWTFLLWGMLQIALFLAYHAIHSWAKRTGRRGLPAWLQILIWFHLLMLTSVVYRSRSVSDFALHMENLLRGFKIEGLDILMTLIFFVGPLLVVEALHIKKGTREFLEQTPWAFRAACAASVYLVVVFCGAPDSWSFIYFHF